MLIRGDDVVGIVKSLAPPFDAETERELIAVAFASRDAKARGLAQKLVAKHVTGAPLIKSTLGAGFHRANDASAKLRRLKIKDRGKLAVAMRAHGAYVAGVAFEEDREFALDRLPRLVRKRELDLHEWYMTPNQVESLELSTIPDVVFDELPRLHKADPFETLMLWGSPPKLPKRFHEFAPYIKTLFLGHCGFTKLPDEVCTLTKLERLYFHEPALERLNPKLVQLQKLHTIDITRARKLKTLPPELLKLPKLRSLELWKTGIRKPPPELAGKQLSLKVV